MITLLEEVTNVYLKTEDTSIESDTDKLKEIISTILQSDDKELEDNQYQQMILIIKSVSYKMCIPLEIGYESQRKEDEVRDCL